MNIKDAINILELDDEPTKDNVHRAFKKLSKKHHPDVGGSGEDFQRILLAYNILSGKDEPKEDFSQASAEFISAVMHVLANTRNTKTTDIIKKVKVILRDGIKKSEQFIETINVDITEIDDVLDRLSCSGKNNLIANVLKEKLLGDQQNIKQQQQRVINLEGAIEIAESYSYRTDEAETNLSVGFGFSTWE